MQPVRMLAAAVEPSVEQPKSVRLCLYIGPMRQRAGTRSDRQAEGDLKTSEKRRELRQPCVGKRLGLAALIILDKLGALAALAANRMFHKVEG